MASDHPSADEVAELALGQADDAVSAHLGSCLQCSEELTAIAEVSQILADEPLPQMPPEVAEQTAQVIAQEVARVREGELWAEQTAALAKAAKRTELGTFGPNLALERKDFTVEARHEVAARNRSRSRD